MSRVCIASVIEDTWFVRPPYVTAPSLMFNSCRSTRRLLEFTFSAFFVHTRWWALAHSAFTSCGQHFRPPGRPAFHVHFQGAGEDPRLDTPATARCRTVSVGSASTFLLGWPLGSGQGSVSPRPVQPPSELEGRRIIFPPSSLSLSPLLPPFPSPSLSFFLSVSTTHRNNLFHLGFDPLSSTTRRGHCLRGSLGSMVVNFVV